jgi:hypothetical protein
MIEGAMSVENLAPDAFNVAAGAVMVAVASALGAAAALSLRRRDLAQLGPTTRRLSRALRLARGERRLIAAAARRGGAPGAALLVSRGCFDRAAAAAGPADQPRLARLRVKLFDGA